MRIGDISVIGWLHTIACVAALVLGAMNLMAAKGNVAHKQRGSAYTAAMLLAMGLSLFVYRFDVPLVRGEQQGHGVFGLFHWLAIATIFLVVVGYYAAVRQSKGFWAYTHPVAMTLSYSLLIGGLINELFARVEVLRPLAYVTIHGRLVFGSRDVQMTQFAADVATTIFLVWFCVKVRRYREVHRAQAATAAPFANDAAPGRTGAKIARSH
jgi:uncharacterized membrane protein